MFFDRFGSFTASAPSAESNSSHLSAGSRQLPGSVYRRRLAVLALAVTMAVPTIALTTSKAEVVIPTDGVQLASDSSITDADALRQGQNLLEKKQYEEALAILQQVNAGNLSAAEKKELSSSLKTATEAAGQHKTALAEYELGEAALKDGKSAEAITHYRAAASNKFVDEGTKQKALTQIQLAEAAAKPAEGALSDKDLYTRATDAFKQQNYTQAKADFLVLKEHNFRAPLFQKSPAEYLRDIDRLSALQTPDNTAVAATPTETPATAQAPAVSQATAAATETPAVAETPAAPDKSQIAKDAYHTAREQYRTGDWENARKNFEIARDNGYKPALFQDGPEKYLARMDAKEAADREAATQLAAAPATAPVDTSAQAAKALDETAMAQDVLMKDQQLQAQALVEQAQAAAKGSQYQKALELYSKALELDPKNEAAASGRTNMQEVTGKVTAASNLLDKNETANRIARQEMQYNFDRAIAAAQQATAKGEYDAAATALNRARVALQTNPQLISTEDFKQLATTIEVTQQSLDMAQAKAQQDEMDISRWKSGEIRAKALADEAANRRRTVQQLIASAKQMINQGQFKEAGDVLQQVLVLDPQNEYAKSVLPLVEQYSMLRLQKQYQDDYTKNYVRQLVKADELKIPYDDNIRYPDDWARLSKERDALVKEEQGQTQEDIQMEAMLNRRLPEVSFTGRTLADAIDFLRDVSGANIYVNWGALQQQNIDQTTPVTVRLRDVRLAKALQVVLQDAGSNGGAGTPVKLDYSLEEGVITISTVDDLTTNAVFEPRTYDLNDLLLTPSSIGDGGSSLLSGGGGSSRTLGSGSSGGSNNGGFNNDGGNVFDDNNNNDDNEDNRADQVTEIEDLIKNAVPADSWQENNPDAKGTITERPNSGVLVIIQTPKNHKTIQTVLDQLRKAQGVQVTVEARFLTVSRSFLEDVGVDFDFQLNSAGGNSQRFSAIPVLQGSSDFTANPLTNVPNGISVLNPSLATGVAYGSILDDFQASLLVTATQASTSATSVNAPRLTLYNGQEAMLVVARDQWYVSDLTPVVGQVGLFNPTISTLRTGIEFRVRAAVSPDRKYVNLDLQPRLTNFNQFTTFTFQTAASGTGGTDGGTSGTSSGTVQLPDQTITTIQTYVTVPDRGTLLLGGQTIAGDVEREAGVPGLSKIPFLKRLFTNRSEAKDDQILLILVKPTIMITHEEEKKAFPMLSSQVQ